MRKSDITTKRIRTCSWILSKIDKSQGLSLAELNELWIRDDLSDGKPMERRTFSNYLSAISSLFRTVIECDTHDNYRYKVTGRVTGDNVVKWLSSSMMVTEVISNSLDLKDRILLEDTPGGVDWIEPLMEAMRQNLKITFGYKRYDEDVVRTISMAEPYCLKVYQQRWYMLVKEYRTLLVSHQKVEEMRVYALDRITNLQVEEETFKLGKDFDASLYFKDVVGTLVEKDNPVENVKLKVNASVAPYLRSLGWHPTMEEVERNADYSIFSLQVALSVELYQQIAMFGSRIEVLEPKDLRDVMRNETWKMAERYGIIEPQEPMSEEEFKAWYEDMKQNHPEVLEEKFCRDAYAGFVN